MSIRSTKTPFKYMKQFKAFAGDYEYLLTLSDQGQLYCLTEQQVYAIEVQLDYIGWLTRWYNTDDVTQTTVDRLKSDIAEALMSCVDISILVDQANENLITTVTNRAIQSQTLRDIYADEYVSGDPTSINPSAPTSTWSYGSSEDGSAALCAALMAFVYQFARSQADSVRAGQVGGLAAISLIAVLLIPGLNIFFVVGAAIAVLAGLGTVGVTTEIAIQALTDTEALDNVVCCMRDNLELAEVSEATWAASLGGCSFEVGSHEQIIADFLGPTLAANYLTFLDFMGTGFDGVEAGADVPACPCEPPPELCEGAETVDFRVNDGMFIETYDRAEYYEDAPRGWGVHLVGSNRISIRRMLAPAPVRMRFNTIGDAGEIRIYNWTTAQGVLLGSTNTYVLNSDGSRTYTLATMTAPSASILIDIGVSVFAAGFRLRWICWNYDL